VPSPATAAPALGQVPPSPQLGAADGLAMQVIGILFLFYFVYIFI
jgi:hypothetical protein